MNINQQCRRALAVGLAAMLILMVGGCRRSARQTAAAPTNESAEQKSNAAELAQAEKERQDSRKRAGAELSAILDKRFDYWKLEWLKEVDGTRFVGVTKISGENHEGRFLVIAPDNRVLMARHVHNPRSCEVEGLYDIDGDGYKEAFISIFNGGNMGYDDCIFVRLRPEAQLMGGSDLCPSGCVKAADIDGDGRTEFTVHDIAGSGYRSYLHSSPGLPMVFGYRGGRFVDLTPRLARDQLRRRIAKARRYLGQSDRRNPNDHTNWWMEEIGWFAAARLLGRPEADVLRDMQAVIGKKGVANIAEHLPIIREILDTRRTRFLTVPEEAPWELVPDGAVLLWAPTGSCGLPTMERRSG
ncbi:MAG: hypothetical protein GX446_19085 [Chthonomonadales bacterium]|nr:hypothetical protein [Chthonomonadales bacterium]